MDDIQTGKVIIYASTLLLSVLVFCAIEFYYMRKNTTKGAKKEAEEATVDIRQNENGGWSIYFAKNASMGSFATYADALKVAKHYNFFNINESE